MRVGLPDLGMSDYIDYSERKRGNIFSWEGSGCKESKFWTF